MPLIFDPPFKTLDSGLVLYAPLWAGELSGVSFNSKDINKHLCTVTGALWTPQGRKFDGVDDHIAVADSALWDFGTGDFTVEVWIKKAANTNVIWGLSPYDTRFDLACSNLIFGIYDAVAATWYPWNDVSLALSTWGHLAFKRESQVMSLALNGVFSATTYANTTNIANKDGVALAASGIGGNEPFTGTIGEVQIYNRALTAVEIQYIYLATKWRYP